MYDKKRLMNILLLNEIKTLDLFGSCFLKLFLKTVFETQKTLKGCYLKTHICYLNLVFFLFFYVFKKKQTENQTCFSCFSCSSYFLELSNFHKQ